MPCLQGAGTSSQVYIEVYDKAGRSSGEHQLVVRGDGKQPFKRGAIDNFQIECCEMGNHLSKVMTRVCGKGVVSAVWCQLCGPGRQEGGGAMPLQVLATQA